jgi:hypothetical protein
LAPKAVIRRLVSQKSLNPHQICRVKHTDAEVETNQLKIMNASQSFHFFPPLRLGTMRAWTNITAGKQPIEIWVSGAIVLRRSIDFDSVLSMAAKYEIKRRAIGDPRTKH